MHLLWPKKLDCFKGIRAQSRFFLAKKPTAPQARDVATGAVAVNGDQAGAGLIPREVAASDDVRGVRAFSDREDQPSHARCEAGGARPARHVVARLAAAHRRCERKQNVVRQVRSGADIRRATQRESAIVTAQNAIAHFT
jgi:hypothetical protein